jgi:hypothetical protein
VLAPLFTGLVFLVCKDSSPRKKTETKINSTTSFIGIEKYFENTILTKDERMEILSPKRFSQLSSEEQKIFHLLHLHQQPQKQTGKEQTAKALENAVGPKYVELIVNNKIMTRSITGVDTKPQFPGGISEFYKFVAKNFKISEEASKMKLKGKVHLKFTIEKTEVFPLAFFAI